MDLVRIIPDKNETIFTITIGFIEIMETNLKVKKVDKVPFGNAYVHPKGDYKFNTKEQIYLWFSTVRKSDKLKSFRLKIIGSNKIII
ncbi:hypothetical protein [Clostridium intestinale]|uniref:hypothetical protein n=1 Tax=Clostridium intestinale TaxID=36845 RepID=UPI000932539C|nr:hypothetical protein [Clostridium intestinale]